MKILLVSPYGGNIGGIARWTYHIVNYYKSLENKEIEMELFPMSRTIFVNKNFNLLYRALLGLKDYTKIIRRFNSIISENKYDLVQISSSASISLSKDLLMLWLAKKRKIKTVIHFHFGRIPDLGLSKNWEWKLLCKVIRMADKVIVLDKMSYAVLRRNGFANIELLPNPIAPVINEVIEANKGLERIYGYVLFAGHVVLTKGVFELVEACKQISGIKLKILGHVSDKMKKELEAISDNGKWLDIIGERPYDEVIKEMMKCDIFVLPTYTEGFPNVILESMACGCAIVTTKVGAIPEMLEEDSFGKYGIMVDPKNTDQLKNAISKMLADDILRSECRANVVRRVNERYNISSVWEKLCKIWNSLI